MWKFAVHPGWQRRFASRIVISTSWTADVKRHGRPVGLPTVDHFTDIAMPGPRPMSYRAGLGSGRTAIRGLVLSGEGQFPLARHARAYNQRMRRTLAAPGALQGSNWPFQRCRRLLRN